MSEVANIAEVANKVSEELLKWFKWDRVPLMDENFNCHKKEKHFGKKAAEKDYKKTHPVDVVFKYFDPYVNKWIFLNTDLKAYSKDSIKKDAVQKTLESLGKTIDCAAGSSEWGAKYIVDSVRPEIRGLLFIYNWDAEYHRDFRSLLSSIKLQDLPIRESQQIHVLDPQTIRYISAVVADMNHLQSRSEFPKKKYTFLYPDLILHKSHGDPENQPATIELLCSPYMIIKHGPVEFFDEVEEKVVTQGRGGYVIYYNQNGSSDLEFLYLFDLLSRLQILSSQQTIKIRIAHHEPHLNLNSNYQRAINSYVSAWGDCSYKRRDLERIELEVVPVKVPNYSPGRLAWRV